MSFVVSQYRAINVEGGGPVFYREPIEGEDGKEDFAFVNQAKELPSMDEFRLKNMLKNGTNLERVDTKMLAPKEFDLNSFELPQQEPKQEPKQEPQQEPQQEPKQEPQQGE